VLSIPDLVVPGRFKHAAVQIVLGTGVMMMCILPWSIRNYRLFGELVPISANAGSNAWMGNSPGSDGFYRALPDAPRINEPQRDRFFGKLASDYIREYPVRFLYRSLIKLVRLHDRETIGVVWNAHGLEPLGKIGISALKIASTCYWWAVLALGLWGIVALVRSDGVLSTLLHPTVLLWGYFAMLHAVTVIADRYHMPSIPGIACLAAVALDRTWLRSSAVLQPERVESAVGEDGPASVRPDGSE
jgi:hypothetical protein